MRRVLGILFGVLLLVDIVFSTFEQSISTGGWETQEEDRLAGPGPCNIDRIDLETAKFTQQMFLDHYAFHKPVIFLKATNNKKFQEICTKEAIMDQYGNNVVRLSSANTHSYRKRDVPLKVYLTEVMKPQTLDTLGNETFYWFGDNDYEEFKALFAEYTSPPFRLPNMGPAYSFGIAGTGVPFHFHGPGFGEVVFGRKRWFMYPPEKQPSFNPNKTTLHWLMEEYNNLHMADMPLECTLDQGDIIYFPDRWWHGTLNIDTSVFISTFLG